VDGSGIATPQAAGTSQQMTMGGLTPGATYYFAGQAQDEVPNLAWLSNRPSGIAQVNSVSITHTIPSTA